MNGTTLEQLAPLRRWVGWRNEDRNGKRTKVPYAPWPALSAAASDKPGTWDTRDKAHRWAMTHVNGQGGGIGLMLGVLDDRRAIGGIDLDTCRDADGTIEPWALDVMGELATYSEVSPSGTGAKCFFTYDPAALPELRAAMGTDNGKAWKRGTGEHPPAIELSLARRYFAFTDEAIDTCPGDLRLVPVETLLRLIQQTGPAFSGTTTRKPSPDAAPAVDRGADADDSLMARIGRATARDAVLRRRWDGDTTGLSDASRSALGMALGGALKRVGFCRSDVRAALQANAHTGQWAVEAGDRGLDRVFDRAAEPDAITAAEPVAPPDAKRPLHRELEPAPAFPIGVLGDLRHGAEAIHEHTRAPLAMCAQSALAAATLAVQAHVDVDLPAGRRPLTGLFVTVAESGERKTSVDRLALRAVYAVEAEWRDRADGEAQAYRNDLDAWKAAREHAKKAAKGNRDGLRQALDAGGPEPKAPPHPMLLVADPTPEALTMHLGDGRPWGGVFTSEGGLLIGGSAFNDESRMRTGALLNTLWDGDPIRRLRVLTGKHYLPGRRCTAHAMMQGVVAARLLGDPMLDGIGLLARTLIVAPETTAGTRMWREASPVAVANLRAYDGRLGALLRQAPRMMGDALDPRPLPLHPDARTMWIAFHDHIEAERRDGGAYAPLRAFASKMAEHAGRLAAVLTIYADPDAGEVGPEALAGGIALAQHYAAELLRLHGGAQVTPNLQLAQRLLAWWQARPDPRCHLAAIYQRSLNVIGDAATARRVVAVLEDHGWIERLPRGTALDGVPRSEAWTLR